MLIHWADHPKGPIQTTDFLSNLQLLVTEPEKTEKRKTKWAIREKAANREIKKLSEMERQDDQC